ncbi:MAG: hypothetical protein HFACDABA_00309 [Anaerolineales bacterium]|nr:hypothetical protein [Anaerolineales bacterium]
MIQLRVRLLILLLGLTLLAACASPSPTAGTPPPAESPSSAQRWNPAPGDAWQIQFSGDLDTSLDVSIFFLDLFDTPESVIRDLHTRGIKVVCSFSAGSHEDWRPDAGGFPEAILGITLTGWPGERWLDIRDLQTLGPLMLGRIRLAVQKGCDGVDPDNMDGYINETGFPLTPNDQLAYNIFLANAAHQNGLSIGLKNDLGQVEQLLPFFDWALNESCFLYAECRLLLPFVNSGKPVFVIEYELSPEEFCLQANAMDFDAMQKKPQLDPFRFPCR